MVDAAAAAPSAPAHTSPPRTGRRQLGKATKPRVGRLWGLAWYMKRNKKNKERTQTTKSGEKERGRKENKNEIDISVMREGQGGKRHATHGARQLGFSLHGGAVTEQKAAGANRRRIESRRAFRHFGTGSRSSHLISIQKTTGFSIFFFLSLSLLFSLYLSISLFPSFSLLGFFFHSLIYFFIFYFPRLGSRRHHQNGEKSRETKKKKKTYAPWKARKFFWPYSQRV